MALYVKKFTVPASTPESSPYETTLTIKEKYIYEMEVSFPDGANWEVGIQINYGIKRLWPENEEEWIWGNDEILVWPPWRKEYVLERKDPLNTRRVYEYRVIAREAVSEADYLEIVELEQHHYASKEEIVAVWRCPVCGEYMESNIQPKCPKCNIPMKLQEIRGSLPSSRFLVLELIGRKEYEPRIVGYVRVDTPIPLMNRRLPDGRVEKMIREKVFPKEWFHPTYWPTALEERKAIISRYRMLRNIYSGRVARTIVGEEVSAKALKTANSRAARIARVVVHPDYRGDGLGILAVKAAVEWIRERRIPEMGNLPWILKSLPEEGRIKGSEQYFRQQLALNNIHYVSDENVLKLGGETEGIAAKYKIGSNKTEVYLFAIAYPDPVRAVEAFESYSNYLKGKLKPASVKPVGERYVAFNAQPPKRTE